VTPGQVARAAFEGVACGLLEALDAVVAAGVECSGRLWLVGGGARSAAYRRVFADLASRPVHVPRVEELVATGACVQAAALLRGRSLDEVASEWNLAIADVTAPDESSRPRAPALRARYALART
jgi:xylulokinase